MELLKKDYDSHKAAEGLVPDEDFFSHQRTSPSGRKAKQRSRAEEANYKTTNYEEERGPLKIRYQEALEKLDALHREAQKLVDPKEKLLRYKVPSQETENINKNYKEMHNEIENMVCGLEKKVKNDEFKFMSEFTDRLRKLHARYRELENLNAQLSSKEKFKADMQAKTKERDALNAECT